MAELFDYCFHKKIIIFILQFSAYGLAAAFLFLLLSPRSPVLDDPLSFFTPDNYSFNNAVESTAPAVVNVYVSRLYQEKELSVFQNPSLQSLFAIPPVFKKNQQNSSIGSGVIMNNRGHILTNAHVVQDAQKIGVTLNSGIQVQAKLIGLDLDTDLAVIKINLKDPPTIPIGDSSKLKIGDIVLAIGNPYNFGQTVTQGIVSATGKKRKRRGISFFDNFIQTDADINQGHSGGALVNTQGELVGINSALVSSTGGSEGIGLATPINQALNVMDEIIENGKVVRGWLGIEVEKDLQIEGVLITATIRGDPADKAGINPGDIILSINGKNTNSPDKIIAMITKFQPDTNIKIKIQRGWKELELTASVIQRPAMRLPNY